MPRSLMDGHTNRPLGPYTPQSTLTTLGEPTGTSEVSGSSSSSGASQKVLVTLSDPGLLRTNGLEKLVGLSGERL